MKRSYTKHGMSHTPEYTAWKSMIQRCENPKQESYPNYGGRGIKVCPPWHNFVSFYQDIGPMPTDKPYPERLNNDGDYEPGNCVWADKLTEARNTRGNHVLEYDGSSKPVSQWAEERGIKYFTVHSRLNAGWSVPEALGFVERPEVKRSNETVVIQWQGREWSLYQISQEVGIAYDVLYMRYKRGWPVERLIEREAKPYEGNLLTFNGKTQSQEAWATEIGISKSALTWRIKAGWSLEKALGVSDGRKGENNRSHRISVTHNGITRTLMEWCQHLDIDYNTVVKRVSRGASVNKALGLE